MNTSNLIFVFLSVFLMNKDSDSIVGIIIFIVVMTLLAVFFLYSMIRRNKIKNEKKEIIQFGKPASAVIIDIKESEAFVQYEYGIGVSLQLLVKPKDSKEFSITKDFYFYEYNMPKQGDTIYVKYNTEDKSQMEIITKNEFITAGGALPSATMQAKF